MSAAGGSGIGAGFEAGNYNQDTNTLLRLSSVCVVISKGQIACYHILIIIAATILILLL